MPHDWRASPRVRVAANVMVEGREYAVDNLSLFGFACRGAPLSSGGETEVEIHMDHGAHTYVLELPVKARYFDPRRQVTGFEFSELSASNIDILLGLMLAAGAGTSMPLAVAPKTVAALRRLAIEGRTESRDGRWVAAAVGN